MIIYYIKKLNKSLYFISHFVIYYHWEMATYVYDATNKKKAGNFFFLELKRR